MKCRSLYHLIIIFLICSVVLILRYAGKTGPDSDTALLPLTALHVMQGKPFPFFGYGPDLQAGMSAVPIIQLMFENLGISYLWAELLFALINAGIITMFSIFILCETNFFTAAVFAATFVLFTHDAGVPIVGLKPGIHSLSVFLGLLNGFLFCWYVNKTISKNFYKISTHLLLFFFIFIVLPGLTYWSSKLGFLHLITISTIGLLGCRKVLAKKFSHFYPRVKALKSDLSIFLITHCKVKFTLFSLLVVLFLSLLFIQLYPEKNLFDYSSPKNIQEKSVVPEIQFAPKIETHQFSAVNFIALVQKDFERIKNNIFFMRKLYLKLFSNFIHPIIFLWAVLPLLLGGYYYFSKRKEFFSFLSGNWTEIKFKWIILAIPFLSIMIICLRHSSLNDPAYIRYFVSLNLSALAFIPLYFSLIQKPFLKNFLLTLYLFLAVASYFHSQPKHYKELNDIPFKINFITSMYSDQLRLSPSEKKLIHFLEDEQLHFGYANYWSSYRLTFLTHERFIISPRPGQHIRYKPYDNLVKSSKNPFYMFDSKLGDDPEAYKRLHPVIFKNLRQKRFNNILIFY